MGEHTPGVYRDHGELHTGSLRLYARSHSANSLPVSNFNARGCFLIIHLTCKPRTGAPDLVQNSSVIPRVLRGSLQIRVHGEHSDV